jgi:hypothetical protein
MPPVDLRDSREKVSGVRAGMLLGRRVSSLFDLTSEKRRKTTLPLTALGKNPEEAADVTELKKNNYDLLKH